MESRKAEDRRRMTFEEAAALDPDEHAGELDAGRWIPLVKNTYRHGEIVVKVAIVLSEYSSQNPGWRVSAGDPGSKLFRDPDTLRGPDVAIVRHERFPTGTGADGWLEGAPDIAVEVVGDSQTPNELLKKAIEYLRAGAKAVWVIDAGPRTIAVMRPDSLPRVIECDGVLDGEDALPGFSCPVSRFFEI